MPVQPARYLLDHAAMRRLETDHADASPPLMTRAGLASANWIQARHPDRSSRLLLLAGPGNNGGDALETATQLRANGYAPVVHILGDPEQYPTDARRAFVGYVNSGGAWSPPNTSIDDDYALIVDGLFGIGLTRPLDGKAARLVATINASGRKVLALDTPSGLDAARGVVRGAAVKATHTLTFIADKPGLHTGDGPDFCGEISLASLDLDEAVAATPHGTLLSAHSLLWPQRAANSHKGMHGDCAIIGGAEGMTGALLLAGRAALLAGAGRVFVASPWSGAPGVDHTQPELMWRNAEALLAQPLSSLALGPGLGLGQAAHDLLVRALAFEGPLLLDADALTLLGEHNALAQRARRRKAPLVLTPHPGEAARLLDSDTAAVQSDRLETSLRLADRYAAHIVLKGCGSILASPDGDWAINPTGNPGLAAAGMGDVLTGVAAALLAQGLPPEDALATATYAHGRAADWLVANGDGPVGLTASEVANAVRAVINQHR